uniref:Methyltransferase domain-containing protein n=1 Tax=Chromera velia CCMP2878 TaxID=1169474 RepID=A0A0G4FA92_9ALVE|eukprot:Cvel_16031.t1-p1 / transcript=Cvel_16031.t1 / gene=Cvel_16031 / organism=Chromera_velia_CCMP2878 / gene_product=Probable UDP-N-acetylglucosamine--peptide, putative / transcript_product=Probable UDP-N-acetylglucosamine--peptide, putative / location=Cvel_scaffold1217:13010-17044(-) / protein_length=606 / sequence_SO=supercontig / SO=protein_coding / is_pseudo=false
MKNRKGKASGKEEAKSPPPTAPPAVEEQSEEKGRCPGCAWQYWSFGIGVSLLLFAGLVYFLSEHYPDGIPLMTQKGIWGRSIKASGGLSSLKKTGKKTGRKDAKTKDTRVPESAEDVQRLWDKASEAFDENRLEEAEELYKRLMRLPPSFSSPIFSSASVWTNLGTTQILKGEMEAAVETLLKAVELDPDSSEAWHNLGAAHRELQQYTQAIPAFQTAAKKAPSQRGALDSLHALGDTMRLYPELLVPAIASYNAALIALYGTTYAVPELPIIPEGVSWAPSQVAYLRMGLAELLLEVKDGQTGGNYTLPCSSVKGECDALALEQAYEIERIGKEAGLEGDAQFEDLLEITRHLIAAVTGSKDVEAASDRYVEALFDDYAETFDASLQALGYSGPAEIRRGVSEVLAELPSDQLPPPGPNSGFPLSLVLDIGCGTGLSGVEVRNLTRRLWGSDLSAGMVEKARQRDLYDDLQVETLVVSLERVAREGEGSRAALVVAADVVVYVGILGDVFEAAERALEPWGLFAFTIEKAPESECEAFREGNSTGWILTRSGRFAHCLDYVQGLCRKHNMRVVLSKDVTVRFEEGKPVGSQLVVAQLQKERKPYR